jgi:hypothetical protein
VHGRLSGSVGQRDEALWQGRRAIFMFREYRRKYLLAATIPMKFP